MEKAAELLLLIKTSAAQIEALRDALGRLHSYEVPEFVVLEPERVGGPYLEWLMSSVG